MCLADIVKRRILDSSSSRRLNFLDTICSNSCLTRNTNSHQEVLQLLVLKVVQVIARWILADSRGDELHQVLASTGLRGRRHCCLFSTNQFDLKCTFRPVACALLEGKNPRESRRLVSSVCRLTVVDLLGPCQHPVPCSYFITE